MVLVLGLLILESGSMVLVLVCGLRLLSLEPCCWSLVLGLFDS